MKFLAKWLALLAIDNIKLKNHSIMFKITFSLLTLIFSTSLYSQCWKSIGRIDGDSVSVSFAIKEDGSLWAWGGNYGLFGNGTTTPSAIPIKIGKDSNWKFINYSQSNVFAIKDDGTLWAWGDSGLGNGTTNSSLVPVQIGIENQWKDVSSKQHTFALKNNGTLWYWGKNWVNGNYVYSLNPTKIGTDADWKRIYNTGVAYIIKNNGTLWQSNYYSGNNPAQIGNETDFKLVINNYAIKTDGSLWFYSNNSNPFLGTKQQVGTKTWNMISEGAWGNDVHGITTDGKLWSINDGIATQIGNESNWKEVTVLGSGNSSNSTKLALKTDGTIYTWGTECCGEFGNGYVDGLPIALPTIVNTLGCLASIDDISMSEDAVNVYPNPTYGLFTISSKEKVVENFTIKNTEGRTVLFIQNSNGVIDIQKLDKGVYFLEWTENSNVKSKLIIKE